MQTFPDVRSLIPHAGPACLLDAVLRSEAGRVECRASIDANHPYMTDGGVPSLLAIELFAQAAAVEHALDADGRPARNAAGRLVAADVDLTVTRLPAPSTLLVRVTSGVAFGDLTKFSGELYLDGPERVLVAQGEVSVLRLLPGEVS